jgi:uncharacterized membrane protein
MGLASIAGYFREERHLHLIFEVSLWLKGVFALSEAAGGIAGFFVTRHFLVAFAQWATRDEFAEDPHDLIANYVLHAAQSLSLGTKYFASAYLLGHGVLKLWLIAGLLRRRLWYYPVSIAVFALFIVYQLYRMSFTGSMWLALLSVIDLVVIVLTWHEWRYLRRAGAQ